MSHLPVIVGFGGISPAGRSALHYGYRRLVFERLSREQQLQTLQSLAVLTGHLRHDTLNNNGSWLDKSGNKVELASFLAQMQPQLLASTLIRKLEDNLFDPSCLPMHAPLALNSTDDTTPLRFSVATRKMPSVLPPSWQLISDDGKTSVIEVQGALDVLVKDSFPSPVNAAGQLPSGFKPETLYAARSHPRGLQMTLFAASDALRSVGIEWEHIQSKVAPDQIAVYAGSSLNQLDYDGYGGLLKARLLGRKVTSKQLPLGFGEMPADFVNAYLLGNVGNTGTNLGACASFLYNLSQAINDIRRGTHRVVIVGASEAPIVPDIIEAFANMGALADDAGLMELDKFTAGAPDHRRACRPFGQNVGFTLAESAQFFVLFDDALALELGATIHGAINDVFINADGYKKSIASPGVGNYLTMAKAAAATQAVLGAQSLQQRSFVQAHGTGTPQNRTTESAIFADIARHFGIRQWPITAMKSYLGHSIACAGGDQLAMTLGVWKHGIIPGILTTRQLADDVHKDNLDFLLQHRDIDPTQLDAALLNSKGFGGNNATASILSPTVTQRMLSKKHGAAALTQWQQRNEDVQRNIADYEQLTLREQTAPLYRYDYDVREGKDLQFAGDKLNLRGYAVPVDLNLANPYPDMV